ncbi:two-component sensor histidine kinase [Nibricoccus aquaticus]|uniref:histidine kinase n=1 Tax=Nibricoccus aquaticus TaxID=2576891 RepID=A0A290QIJ4_9BACT|nr:ATP-binding protein [Nibricoccus aquaticus]ATC64161.1 two-component sensor histidine kinase [Nibricoccus aquaticus]
MSSLSRRLTLGFATLVTITTALVLTVGGWLLSRQMVNGLDFLNAAEFAELRERLEDIPAPPDAAEVSLRIREHAEIDAAMYYFQVHTPDGAILFRSPNLGDAALPIPPDEIPPSWTDQLPTLGPLRISEFQAGSLRIQVASPLAPTRRLIHDYTRVSAWLLAATALASFGLGHAFTRFALKPLRLIRDTALRIRADRLDERIPVSTARDEINSLATLLNQMFDRLEASFIQVKRFTADASHELKTPLTLIRLNAEKLRPAVAADPAAHHALEDLLTDISRLNQIIESLLFIAKAESGTLTLPRRTEDTAAFLNAFAEDALALAEDRGLHFTLAANPAAPVTIEPNLLRQLLLNLVSNALNVSPPASTLSLTSRLDDQHWTLALTDEGPGLPPDKLEHIFERFVRYDHTRTGQNHSGQGLGLAICRSIVGLHGGTIHAENRPDRPGLRVTVQLPR